jgi:hypothetical protein
MIKLELAVELIVFTHIKFAHSYCIISLKLIVHTIVIKLFLNAITLILIPKSQLSQNIKKIFYTTILPTWN